MEKNQFTVVLRNIRHGSREDNKHIIYAEVHDATTDELLISATLDYCLDRIATSDMILVKEIKK